MVGLDVVTERFEQRGDVVHRGRAVGMTVHAGGRRVVEHPDPQAAWVSVELGGVRPRRRRRGVRIAGHRPVDRVEHRRGVAHRSS